MQTIEDPMSLKGFGRAPALSPPAEKVISHLRSYQSHYPDYSPRDWVTVLGIGTPSVKAVAKVLAGMADWSMRGIEISQRDLASKAGISQKSVQRAVSRLEREGFLVRYRRIAKSNGTDVTQEPDAYRLCIPGGAVWGVPEFGGEVIRALPEHGIAGSDDAGPAELHEDPRMDWLYDETSPDFLAGYLAYKTWQAS